MFYYLIIFWWNLYCWCGGQIHIKYVNHCDLLMRRRFSGGAGVPAASEQSQDQNRGWQLPLHGGETRKRCLREVDILVLSMCSHVQWGEDPAGVPSLYIIIDKIIHKILHPSQSGICQFQYYKQNLVYIYIYIIICYVKFQTHISGKKHKAKLSMRNVWPLSIFNNHPYVSNSNSKSAGDRGSYENDIK